GLEGFDLRLLDFGQRQLGPRPVVEKLLIAFPVKLDRPLLFRLGGSDPLIKRGLKLAERWNVLAQFFGGKGSWQRLRFFERSEERRVGTVCGCGHTAGAIDEGE